MPPEAEARLGALLLHHEIEQFFFAEADLLDGRRFDDWLALFTNDARYWMPIARNVRFGEAEAAFTRERCDAAWMDEGKETLAQRVQQLATGIHWADEPASRMSHIISNLRILSAEPDMAAPAEVTTRCRFIVYRNRQQDEVDLLVGKRVDRLRRTDDGWRIARREVYLDQSVLLAKNLTTFF